MLILAILLQATPLQECSVGADVEMAECWDAAYARADSALNKLWPDVLKGARAADQAFSPTQRRARPSAASDLLASQRAWIAFRDTECAAEADYAQGGSLENIIMGQCKVVLTRERVAQLKNIDAGYREQ